MVGLSIVSVRPRNTPSHPNKQQHTFDCRLSLKGLLSVSGVSSHCWVELKHKLGLKYQDSRHADCTH